MGFWYPVSKEGYYAPTPVNIPTNVIFYFETLCALSALADVESKTPHGSRVLIYTDEPGLKLDSFHPLAWWGQQYDPKSREVSTTSMHSLVSRLTSPRVSNSSWTSH